MLKFLRNKKNQKRIYIILSAVILPPFLFWGVTMNSKEESTTSTLGVINGKNITIKDYLAAYRAVQHEISIVYGSRAKEAARYLNFKGRAWDRLLLLDYAKKEKIRVKDEEVVQWLISQPAFLHQGRFDQDFYDRYVNQALRISPRDFEEEIRQMLTLAKVQEKIEAGVSVSEEELKKLYDEEYGARDIRYAALKGDETKTAAEVTDEDISKIYPLVKDRLTDPEKVKIRYVVVPNEKAESMKAVLSENTSLEEIAKKYSLIQQEIPYFSRNDAVPEIGSSKAVLSAAFSLPVDGESEWIHTDKGIFKIRVVEKKDERVLPLEEAKTELRRVLAKQKAAEETMKRMSEIRKKIVQPGDFEKILSAEGIEVKNANAFAKDSGLPSVGMLPEGAAERLAALAEGQVSDAISAENGALLVQVEKRHAPDMQKFESEKKEFKDRVIERKSREAMTELLEKLRSRLTMNLELMKKLSV